MIKFRVLIVDDITVMRQGIKSPLERRENIEFVGEAPSTRVAKKMSSAYLVWTGENWSSVMAEAKTFETAEAADEYIRANSERVMKDG